MYRTLSVIVPVYNERSNIEKILFKIRENKIDGINQEIILVDDGSTDGSREFLQTLVGPGIKVIFNERNLGKGGSVRNGFAAARGDIVIIQDADLEYDPSDYSEVIRPIVEAKAEAVIGVRIKPEGEKLHQNILYRLGVGAITQVTNILYLNDAAEYTGGYKAFSKKLVDSIKVDTNGFDYEHELVCKILKKGYKVATVPIHYYPRSYSDGKKLNKWRDGAKILWAVIKYRFVD